METPGRLAALAVVVLLLGGATALVLRSVGPDDGVAGTYPVRITGPDGDLWNGTVALTGGSGDDSEATPDAASDDATAATAAPATAHAALLAAAEAGGFDVSVRRQRGYEPCDLYVERIGEHGEDATGGWVYEVHRDGAWTRPVVGACAFPLQPGDRVWWHFEAGGSGK